MAARLLREMSRKHRLKERVERALGAPAIVRDAYGSVDVLRLAEIDTPVAGESEVLARVHTAGLDEGVWHLMTPSAQRRPTLPPIAHVALQTAGPDSRLSSSSLPRTTNAQWPRRSRGCDLAIRSSARQ